MALDTVTPANPPMAAVPVKAWVKIETMVGIRLPMFSTMITRPNIRYPRLITGTSFTNILLKFLTPLQIRA